MRELACKSEKSLYTYATFPLAGSYSRPAELVVIYRIRDVMGNTILCVDDESHGLMIRRMLLERVGYSVLTAETAREGLALFSRQPIDAVVLDYYLPDVDGGRAATAMRLIKPEVPIILFSVQWSLPEDAHSIADAVLGKGQHPVGLLNLLEELLRTRQAQRA